MQKSEAKSFQVCNLKDCEGDDRKQVAWLCADRTGLVSDISPPSLDAVFAAVATEFPGSDDIDLNLFLDKNRLVMTDVPVYVTVPGMNGELIEWRDERPRISLAELRKLVLRRAFKGAKTAQLWLGGTPFSYLKMGKRT